jgi:hypothetical protein
VAVAGTRFLWTSGLSWFVGMFVNETVEQENGDYINSVLKLTVYSLYVLLLREGRKITYSNCFYTYFVCDG